MIGAVVLAAGQASRMGEAKAVADIGGRTALERVCGALRGAGVDTIVVVRGYHAELVEREAVRLGVRSALNEDPARGMLSSVQAGIAALGPADGFFVIPVDYALTRTEVLIMLLEAFASGGFDVVHPCCAGVRGHPPLNT